MIKYYDVIKIMFLMVFSNVKNNKKLILNLKIKTLNLKARGMAQVIEHLPSKCKALLPPPPPPTKKRYKTCLTWGSELPLS
jgi:hypothetical protein